MNDDLARTNERRLLLLHSPAPVRDGLGALIALGDRLAQIHGSGREPMLRQMRLIWWRDALLALDRQPPPAEPLLVALAAEAIPRGVAGAMLAPVAEAWEALIGGTPDRETLDAFAAAAGADLFGAAAKLLAAPPPPAALGEGWALALVARTSPEPAMRSLASAMAGVRLEAARPARVPRALRPLAMVAALARSDLAGVGVNAPSRAALLWRIRLFGR